MCFSRTGRDNRAASVMRTFVAAILAAALSAGGAVAQSEETPEAGSTWLEEMSEQYGPIILGAPSDGAAIGETGDPLELAFARLASEDPTISAAALKEINEVWNDSGSPSMELLKIRALRALGKQDLDTAEAHLTQLVNLAPDYAYGWVLRAGVRLKAEKFGLALADAAEALRLEPRQFEAMALAGAIFFRLDRKKEALGLARAALAINPHMQEAQVILRESEMDVEGVDT